MEKLAEVEEELDAQRQQLKVPKSTRLINQHSIQTKHIEELQAFTNKVNETKFRPKFSAELLRLRKQQELLAKMHEYVIVEVGVFTYRSQLCRST